MAQHFTQLVALSGSLSLSSLFTWPSFYLALFVVSWICRPLARGLPSRCRLCLVIAIGVDWFMTEAEYHRTPEGVSADGISSTETTYPPMKEIRLLFTNTSIHEHIAVMRALPPVTITDDPDSQPFNGERLLA